MSLSLCLSPPTPYSPTNCPPATPPNFNRDMFSNDERFQHVFDGVTTKAKAGAA
jgi:hypothetical protein